MSDEDGEENEHQSSYDEEDDEGSSPDEDFEDAPSDDESEDDDDDDDQPVETVNLDESSEEDDDGSDPPIVRVAQYDDDEEDDDDDAEEDDEYEEDYNANEDFASLEARASDLVAEGLIDEAIDILKTLTGGLVRKLPELEEIAETHVQAHRNYVYGALALWIEVLRDARAMEVHKGRVTADGSSEANLPDQLTSWLNALLADENLDLDSSTSEEEDEDDKAIVKEFAELLDELKQPPKKKVKA
jgi:chromatin segregation and condensation protein Rec8/ScpA/Scc1 (kleisin family)